MQKINAEQATALLKLLAVEGRVLSYQAFATQLGINEPPIIGTVTRYLETSTIDDFNNGRPVLASVVVQKENKMVPRPGFFQLLSKLGLFNEDTDDEDELNWILNERSKLRIFYTLQGSQS